MRDLRDEPGVLLSSVLSILLRSLSLRGVEYLVVLAPEFSLSCWFRIAEAGEAAEESNTFIL